MKKYNTPETKSLNVNAQSFICASGGAPKRQGQLGNMEVTNGSWG